MSLPFTGTLAYRSNFHHSPIWYASRLYDTGEHLFQAIKAVNSDDHEAVRLASTPGKAKRLGRKVNLRPDWETIKIPVMLLVQRLKYSQHPKLGKLLVSSTDTIIEVNHWHDNFWGDCSCERCRDIVGLNSLGKCINHVRFEYAVTGAYLWL